MAWNFWRIPARLAWRDLRGSRLKSAFIVCAMAISIASVAGVYGAAVVVRRNLGRDSRVWLTADVAADTTEPVGDDQIAALDQMRREGIDWTMVTWTMTMAASDQSPEPTFIGVKAIEPAKYPFYGATTLDPPLPLSDALGPDRVVVSDRVLAALHVKTGDRIRIGNKPFVISAVIAAEPERFNGIFNWGPQCILSRDGFERIAAAAGGNTFVNRVLLRLARGVPPKHARDSLQSLLPEARVFDYREAAAPEVARIELVIAFVSILAFLALVLGAVGVATAVRLNLEQRIESMAILRINGAQSSQIAVLFLFEIASLLAAGLLLGLPLGWAMKGSLLSLAAKYLVLPHSGFWERLAMQPGMLAAVAITAPLLAAPADALRRLSPLVILRRDSPEVRPFDRRTGSAFAAAALIAMLASAWIAYGMIEAWKPAVFLVSALAASAALTWMIGAGALRCVSRSRRLWLHVPALKYALLGICRAGNRSLIPIVCVALGVMMIAATFDSSGAVIGTVSAALPFSGANLLIADFDDAHRQAVRSFLLSQPGVENVDMLTQTWLRIARVNGVAIEDGRYLGTCSASPQSGAILADDLAARIGARVGSVLEFETRDGIFRAPLSAIHHPAPQERFWFTFLVDCGSLPRSSLIQAAAVRARADRVEAVRKAVNAHFPALAAITSQEIDATIRGVSDDAMTLVRAVTWSAAIAGLFILIAVVAASRATRAREVAILITLGATRCTLFRIYSLEFAAIGILAGIVGSFLGSGLNDVILSVLFHRVQIAFSWRVVAGTILVCPWLTLGAGWLPTLRLLDSKPMTILRHE